MFVYDRFAYHWTPAVFQNWTFYLKQFNNFPLILMDKGMKL